MFIFWGKKRVERKLGLAADFCPICRTVRPFKLIRVGVVGHVYFISFGAGALAGFYGECCECKVHLETDPSRYLGVSKDKTATLESLVQQTFPTIYAAYANRLEAETQLANDPASLSPDQRRVYLMEPFSLLNPKVESQYSDSMKFDKQSSLGCLGTFLIGGGLFYLAMSLSGNAQDTVLKIAGVLFGIGMVYSLLQIYLAQGRVVRRSVLPVLARSLAPLEPSPDEIESCLAHCKTMGMKIGLVLKGEQISRELWKLWKQAGRIA